MTEFSTEQFDHIPEFDRGISSRDNGPTSAELEVIQRQELAVVAVNHVADVLKVDVSIPMLVQLADRKEAGPVRLAAVRALRCIQSVAKKDSAVVAKIGEENLYHYVEAVIEYGASEAKFLELVDTGELSPMGVTGSYDLREQIAEYTDGRKPGFRTFFAALGSIGISPAMAASDPEYAAQALDENGFFTNGIGNITFARTRFTPGYADATAPIHPDDTDGTFSRSVREGFRSWFARHPEEIED